MGRFFISWVIVTILPAKSVGAFLSSFLFFITGEYHFPKNMTRLSSPMQEYGNESERMDSSSNLKMLSFLAQEHDNG